MSIEMSRPRTRAEIKRQTREALVDAGVALLGRQGLDVPSLDAICDAAGYTRGAFYVHFKDRDDFLIAVMDRVGRGFLDAVIASGAHAGDLGVTVRNFIAAVDSGAYPLAPKGGVRPHQLLDACARSPVIRARYVALVEDTLRRLTTLAQKDKDAVRQDLPASHLAIVLLCTVIGAQTLLELEVPLEAGPLARSVLAILSPPGRAKKSRT
jgi:AcrR family transcriptional regulator